MILLINATICFAIAVRLFLFQRRQDKYKLVFALIAWGLICSSAAVAIFTVFNRLSQVETAQTIMNLLVFICMLKTKGNIAQFVYHLSTMQKKWQSKTPVPRQNKKVKSS